MKRTADFRSDTVTRPDPAMRRAMAEARVGDDVFGDDPTVRDLEERAARLFRKEAAVFCPSGTMANQAAVGAHCRPGDEVILHEGCHTYRFEQGALARLHGVQAVPLRGEEGCVDPALMEAQVRADDQHFPRTRLIVLENTHNLAGGTVLPPEHMEAVRELADRHGLSVHLDGARLMNAAVALGLPVARLGQGADSVTLCLSKGLGAPAGTLLMGDGAFIERARRMRKVLGGGMRQAGVLAAPAILALEEGPARLAADHDLAAALARSLEQLPGVRVTPPRTNILVVELPGRDPAVVLKGLAERSVLAVPFGPGRLRFVTHRDVGAGDAERAATALAELLERSA